MPPSLTETTTAAVETLTNRTGALRLKSQPESQEESEKVLHLLSLYVLATSTLIFSHEFQKMTILSTHSTTLPSM